MSQIDIDQLDQSGDIRTIADEAGAYDPTGATRRDLVKRGVLGAGALAAGSAIAGLLSPMEAFAAANSNQVGAYSRNRARIFRDRRFGQRNDVKIGNYALTLEYIEAAFYAAAVQQNYPDPDINQFAKTLADHEAAHVSALRTVLGTARVQAPELNTSAVTALLANQNTFVTAAAQIEPVGVAAYAGAGPYVYSLPIQRAALSIHSVEADHAAYAAALLKFKGINAGADPVPNEFNPAFSFNRVVGIVTRLGVVDGDLQPT